PGRQACFRDPYRLFPGRSADVGDLSVPAVPMTVPIPVRLLIPPHLREAVYRNPVNYIQRTIASHQVEPATGYRHHPPARGWHPCSPGHSTGLRDHGADLAPVGIVSPEVPLVPVIRRVPQLEAGERGSVFGNQFGYKKGIILEALRRAGATFPFRNRWRRVPH